ncbi:MAG: hypothetical protein R3C03_03025 [Pirellulaceae bacterium]
MNALAENPLYVVLFGMPVVVLLFIFGSIVRDKRLTFGGVGALLLMLLLIAYAQVTVTDREAIVNSVYKLADDVRRNDVQGVVDYVSTKRPHTIQRVKSEMPDYIFKTCYVNGIRDVRVQQQTSPPTAEVDFVVFVDVDATKRYDYAGRALRGITLKFEKEAESDWKIVDYSHYDPRSGAELGE